MRIEYWLDDYVGGEATIVVRQRRGGTWTARISAKLEVELTGMPSPEPLIAALGGRLGVSVERGFGLRTELSPTPADTGTSVGGYSAMTLDDGIGHITYLMAEESYGYVFLFLPERVRIFVDQEVPA